MVDSVQESLHLPIQQRCKRCGRKIKSHGYGSICYKNIISNFKKLIDKNDFEVIADWLSKEGFYRTQPKN